MSSEAPSQEQEWEVDMKDNLVAVSFSNEHGPRLAANGPVNVQLDVVTGHSIRVALGTGSSSWCGISYTLYIQVLLCDHCCDRQVGK